MIKRAAFIIIVFFLLVSYACASQGDELFEAIQDGNIGLVKELVKNGADVNCIDKTGQSPLHRACYLGHLDIVRVLIANGADIHQRASDLQLTPLHSATMNGDCQVVAFLIDNGADIHARDAAGGTPLLAACWVGALDTVKYLISKGAGNRFQNSTRGYTLALCMPE